MFQRSIKEVVERYSKFLPVIGITGPRQSGKTTLAKMLFPHLPHVSLEDLDTRMQAKDDMRVFLSKYYGGAIFDEVQHVPELLSYLQGVVNDSPQKGLYIYIITGSQNFALNHNITPSLAGRVGMVTLLPLSLSEIQKTENPLTSIFKGGYPSLRNLSIHSLDFYPNYVQAYIERDIRQLQNIGDLNQFHNFIKLCADRVGQLVNFSSLAQDCDISHTTARQWLNILEASYIIFFLHPFYKNFNKRLIKMPKLYFYDTGLACNLLGIEQDKQVETHYLKWALYENLVILELLKGRLNLRLPANFYFWRDKTGHEIDCVGEWGGKIKAIEIKFKSTLQKDFIKNLTYFSKFDSNIENYLVYNGTHDGGFLNTNLTIRTNCSNIKMTKIRLDEYLLQKGFVTDITIARSLIIQGKVHNKHEQLIKPGIQVNINDTDIKVKLPKHNYVSRGALKLIAALDYFKIDPENLVCIDIGSSTGGFTEVLLERKAELIFAVDVGYGELHPKLRGNPQIKVLEKTNARYLTDKQIITKPDLIVCDASFISLTTILPTPLNLAKEDCMLIALIKPQFEVEKYEVEQGGIIKNPLLHQKVCDKIKDWLEKEHNFKIFGIIESSILGAKGNKEFLIYGKRKMVIFL